MTAIGSKLGRSRIGRIGRQSIGSAQTASVTPYQNTSYIIQKGDPGEPGAPGLNGLNGSKILNGAGDPDNWLTALTIINDYYIDTVAGAMWQREAATMDFTPTIIDLPGGVRWRRVAILKGPAGLQRLDENTIIELNQDIKSETDNVPRMKFKSTGLTAYQRLFIQELVNSFSEFIMSAYDGVAEKQLFRLKARNDDGDSIIEFHGNNMSAEHKFAQYDGVGRLFSIYGSALRVPNQTTAEISANSQAQNAPGALVYDTTTGTLKISTGSSFIEVLLNSARLVLGGTDNLTDKLQVTGNIMLNGDLKVSSDAARNLGAAGLGFLNVHVRNVVSNSNLTLSTTNTGSTAQIIVGAGVAIQVFNSFSFGRRVQIQNAGAYADIPSARLAVNSTTEGFLCPRLTTAQINAIVAPANGLQVYNTDLSTICFYNGTSWQKVTSTAM